MRIALVLVVVGVVACGTVTNAKDADGGNGAAGGTAGGAAGSVGLAGAAGGGTSGAAGGAGGAAGELGGRGGGGPGTVSDRECPSDWTVQRGCTTSTGGAGGRKAIFVNELPCDLCHDDSGGGLRCKVTVSNVYCVPDCAACVSAP